MEVTLQADLLDAAAGAAVSPAAASSVKVQPTATPAEPGESKEAVVEPARESIEAAAEATEGEGRSHSAALDAPAALPSETSGKASDATWGPGGPAAAVVSGEAASPGSDGALAKAQAEEDPGAVFAARVGAAIEARKTYPEAARRRGAEGVVRLRLRVSPDGRLVAARLAAGSGSSLLDRAALGLASSVFPLDNPARRELEFALAVRYSLEDR
jgi:protein TonB